MISETVFDAQLHVCCHGRWNRSCKKKLINWQQHFAEVHFKHIFIYRTKKTATGTVCITRWLSCKTIWSAFIECQTNDLSSKLGVFSIPIHGHTIDEINFIHSLNRWVTCYNRSYGVKHNWCVLALESSPWLLWIISAKTGCSQSQ